MPEFLNPVKGFGVTFATMFKKVLTEEYPEVKRPVAPRFHGRHQLNRHPDGLEKCIGCELCAWACPADAIYVEGADNTESARYSPGERYGRVYQINYLRCIFCGLCIEACPTRALTMTNEYELADDSREGLIYEKQDLLAGPTTGMVLPPHPMPAGMDDQDYYAGRVTADMAVPAPTPARTSAARAGGDGASGAPVDFGGGSSSADERDDPQTSDEVAPIPATGAPKKRAPRAPTPLGHRGGRT